jgi:predicted phage terminase large subunit-like protein
VSRLVLPKVAGLGGEPPLTEEERFEKELCERSLHEFIRVFWPEVEGETFMTNWHLEGLCEHLEAVKHGIIRKLVINGPPRHSKSGPVSVFFQPWDWISSPGKTWLTAANTQRLAVFFNYKSRAVMQCKKYIRYWGDKFQISDDDNLKTQFSNTENGRRLAVGVQTRFIGSGGNRKILDDPHMPDDTPEAMADAGTWFFKTFSTRTDGFETAISIVNMQRLSIYDLTEQIKTNFRNQWEFFIFPSRFDPAKRYFTCLGWTDPRTQKGELLWPAYMSEESERSLREELNRDGNNADAQMDQDPINNTDSIYKEANLNNRYKTLIYDKDCDIVISTTDTGVKSTSTSDYTASVILLKKGQRYFHIEGFAKKQEIGDLLKTYSSQLSKWINRDVRFYKHLVEDSSNGPALVNLSSKRFSRMELIRPAKNKLTRLKSVVPDYEADKVWFPASGAKIIIDDKAYELDTDWVEEWLSQTRRVPNGANDDCPDATAQGILFLDNLNFSDMGDATDYEDEDGQDRFFRLD